LRGVAVRFDLTIRRLRWEFEVECQCENVAELVISSRGYRIIPKRNAAGESEYLEAFEKLLKENFGESNSLSYFNSLDNTFPDNGEDRPPCSGARQ
jgi:hypothetical protein